MHIVESNFSNFTFPPSATEEHFLCSYTCIDYSFQWLTLIPIFSNKEIGQCLQCYFGECSWDFKPNKPVPEFIKAGIYDPGITCVGSVRGFLAEAVNFPVTCMIRRVVNPARFSFPVLYRNQNTAPGSIFILIPLICVTQYLVMSVV